MTAAQIMNTVIALLTQTAKYKDQLKEWRALPVIQHVYANFKKNFKKK